MKVIIVGCGKIGKAIIGGIVTEGHDIVVIDDKKEVLTAVSNRYDVMCVAGSGTDCETLEEAGVGDAEVFVAVTSSDEINMLSCFIAKRMGAKYTVARIRNPEIKEKQLAFLKQQLDISYIINPDLLAAKEIFNILRLPNAVNIETFSRRNFEMIEFLVKSEDGLAGLNVAEIRKKYKGKYLVSAVGRKDEVFIPDGNFVIEAGDKIGVTANPSEIQKLFKQLGILKKQARSIMILGASRSAYYLAAMLTKNGNDVKIVDMRKERCEEFAKLLPDVTVIYGNGTEQEVLMEEGLTGVDAFVALTGMDEENILVSCFAQNNSVPKVIAKVNRSELVSITSGLGLDTIVSPKRIISDVLVRYLRAINNTVGSNIETLYKLMGGKVETLEFIVDSKFQYLNLPLKELKLKKNVLVAGILRGRKAIIPAGDDFISAGDRVIVISAGENIKNLSDIIG